MPPLRNDARCDSRCCCSFSGPRVSSAIKVATHEDLKHTQQTHTKPHVVREQWRITPRPVGHFLNSRTPRPASHEQRRWSAKVHMRLRCLVLMASSGLSSTQTATEEAPVKAWKTAVGWALTKDCFRRSVWVPHSNGNCQGEARACKCDSARKGRRHVSDDHLFRQTVNSALCFLSPCPSGCVSASFLTVTETTVLPQQCDRVHR